MRIFEIVKENVNLREAAELYGIDVNRYSRSSHQSIRIVYRDIGTVDSAMEQGEAQPRIAPPLSEVFELPA